MKKFIEVWEFDIRDHHSVTSSSSVTSSGSSTSAQTRQPVELCCLRGSRKRTTADAELSQHPSSHPPALWPDHIVQESGNQDLSGSAESTTLLTIDEGIEKGYIGMYTYIMYHMLYYLATHVGLSR